MSSAPGGVEPRQTFVVLTNPTPGLEADFNTWYDEVHLPEVLAVDGIVSAQRFRLSRSQMPGVDETVTHTYLTLYEIEGDADEVFAALQADLDAGRIVLPDLFDVPGLRNWLYQAITERVTGADVIELRPDGSSDARTPPPGEAGARKGAPASLRLLRAEQR